MEDAGYDNCSRNKRIKEGYNINPIIDIVHRWDKTEKYREIKLKDTWGCNRVYCAFFHMNNKFLMEHTVLHYEYIKKVKYKQNRMGIYGINQTKIGTNG